MDDDTEVEAQPFAEPFCEDDEVTAVIPRETMEDVRASGARASVRWGEGHDPIGPDRPTRDMRPLARPESESDGVPEAVCDTATANTLPRQAA